MSSADELARRIIESQRYESRLFDALHKCPPAERNAALLEVVLRGDPTSSVSATMQLIRENAVETAPMIARHIVTQFDERQLQILSRMRRLHRTKGPWLCIPRAILAALPQRADRDPVLGKARSPLLGVADPLGCAALLLANSNDADDHRLVRSAVPYEARSSSSLWVACMKLGIHDKAFRVLAVDVMNDTTQSEPLARIAAATAIADVDENALEFVITEFGAMVARNREQTDESIVAAFLNPATPPDGKLAFIELGTNLQAIGFLQFLRDKRTHDLLVDTLSAKNSQLAMTAAFVLLRRSPERLVRCDLSGLSDDDYAVLMAVAKVAYPSLSLPTRGAGLLGQVQEIKDRIKALGIVGACGAPARSVFGL